MILTTLTEKNCVLINSLQELIEEEVWLLLAFFMCLHNQLSSLDTFWQLKAL